MYQVNKEKTIYKGKIITVKTESLHLPNGKDVDRERVLHQPAVGMLAIYNNQVILVKQYRTGIHEFICEIPAGLLENGEDPKACALRELQEETGFSSNSVTFLGKFLLSPGYSNELIYLYLCENLYKSQKKGDDDEFIEISYLDIDQISTFLDNCECNDIKTALALSLYLNKNTSNCLS